MPRINRTTLLPSTRMSVGDWIAAIVGGVCALLALALLIAAIVAIS